jgi:TorA maturation chaperone TorD
LEPDEAAASRPDDPAPFFRGYNEKHPQYERTDMNTSNSEAHAALADADMSAAAANAAGADVDTVTKDSACGCGCAHPPIEQAEACHELLFGRSASYRMFSRLFLKPLSQEEIEELAAMDLHLKALDLKDSEMLAQGFNDMGRGLRKRHTGTRQLLSTDYTMCFDGVEAVNEEVAVPYASIFLGEKALFNQEPRNAVYRLFCAENVTLKQNVNLPEDHLSFELEFLAVLSERADAAIAAGDIGEALRNLELSRDFICKHILTWLDLLSERALKILKTRFYRGVIEATRGYLELDLATLGDILEELGDGQQKD